MRGTRSRLAHSVLGILGILVSGGCSSATRFYTLSKVAGGSAIDDPAAQAPMVIALGPVQLADYADRPQIVIRESAYSIRLASFDQWAGTLDDMLPRVLAENLAERLPRARIVPFPRVSGPNIDCRVAISITQFDVSSAGEAVVAASWQVYDRAGTKTLLINDTTARAHAASQRYEDRVAALSQAIGDLSNEIAGALASLPR